MRSFAWDAAPSLAALLSEDSPASRCLRRCERELLESLLAPTATPTTTPERKTLLLDSLASLLLLRPCLAVEASRLFAPVLPDIVARWSLPLSPTPCAHHPLVCTSHPKDQEDLEDLEDLEDARSPKHARDGAPLSKTPSSSPTRPLLLALALARLLPLFPRLAPIAFALFESLPSPLASINIPPSSPSHCTDCTAHLREITVAVHALVAFNPAFFAGIWSPAPLHLLIASQDTETRSAAARSLALFVGLSDHERQQLLIAHGITSNSDSSIIPRAILPPAAAVASSNSDSIWSHHPLTPKSESQLHPFIISASDLSPFTVDVCGVLLPRIDLISRQRGIHPTTSSISDLAKSQNTPLIRTHTTASNLHRIALAISLGNPMLIEGPSGSGKTALVEEAARLVNAPDILKVHLGDQTDSKLLLGTYMTTSTPGSFRWQPGVLTTAVSEGRWILIEDIDLAPVDVIAILVPLLETRWLHIASRGERIRAKDGFRIFATRRTASNPGNRHGESRSHRIQAANAHRHLGEGLWSKLVIDELNQTETCEIISAKFPALESSINVIIAAFSTIRDRLHQLHAAGRQLSLRDLIKWCKRSSCRDIKRDANTAQIHEALFREGLDCFAAMAPQRDTRRQLALSLAKSLDIPEHRAEFYLDHFVPTVSSDETTKRLTCGRVHIPVFDANAVATRRSPFAATQPSLRLLESLSAAVSLHEPVLLVGETGTGKTTVVQHLASLVGTKLVVINMSQQSDSTDLLGGFKPVDAILLAANITELFDSFFAKTFPIKTNGPFLESIRKAYVRRHWAQLIVGFRTAVKMAKKVFDRRRDEAVEAELRLENGSADHGKASNTDTVHDTQTDVKQLKPVSTEDQQKTQQQPPRKRKRRDRAVDPAIEADWIKFELAVNQFAAQLDQIKNNFLFSFVEGSLVKALSNGAWILLDEINLATAETLECLSGLLQSADGSLLLLERGDTAPVKRHANFRLFACMNPANDAGKRDLPPGLRSRFTELWVDAPDAILSDLLLIIRSYIFDHLPPGIPGERICNDVAAFYSAVKALAIRGTLYDGADQRVHISMRTLTRALSYAMQIAPVYGIKRSLYEGMYMTFLTGLGTESMRLVHTLLKNHVLSEVRNPDSFIRQVPKHPTGGDELADLAEDVYRDSEYTLVDCFWIKKGPLAIPDDLDRTFVLTPSVNANLTNLGRAVLSRRFPVLIQGPTSAGKTSMVEYLAKRTGHRFLRINNHEHTDIQEYLGGYVSNDQGAIVFRDGVLVEALRKGYWIVLDELNLAPSDVLEALNRLLDDNRELFLPETQETIRPHPHFMLFATQNPAGQYGGRKQLSRAFRNRFLELHFTDIPETELETILEKRCRIAPSYAKKLVGVYKGMQRLRDTSRIFDGRQSFVTIRDLFRWALRGADSYERLALDGYMLLAERVRNTEYTRALRGLIETELRVRLDVDTMYDTLFTQYANELGLGDLRVCTDPAIQSVLRGMVWTRAMRRLFVLVATCVRYSEPVLLVGETGCGKTTVCQLIAVLLRRRLHIVNAHQNSETADFLGSQRPVRGRDQAEVEFRHAVRSVFVEVSDVVANTVSDVKSNCHVPNPDHADSLKVGELLDTLARLDQSINEFVVDAEMRASLSASIAACTKLGQRARALFAWNDGPLVQAMRQGHLFLLDEISLADDSVLERLNSVLEPQRLLVLAENGARNVDEIVAADGFEFFATMNPGGDYGKKELSPALRNRFTEIWVSSVSDRDDLLMILTRKMDTVDVPESVRVIWAGRILDFLQWLADQLHKPVAAVVSLRDILAWVGFMCKTWQELGLPRAYFHGGCMVLVDGMGINPMLSVSGSATSLCARSRALLYRIAHAALDGHVDLVQTDTDIHTDIPEFENCVPFVKETSQGGVFGADCFVVPLGDAPTKTVNFAMQAPTTLSNCMRVLRAMQLNKPVLLEGSPGVGKTSLVTSLAAVSRHRLVRINLSEQTDLMDLFGSDLPVEGGSGGEFSWHDGPFLHAMQQGDWVLLDELNLAPQQVLEGLNACLDHRSTIYIPELDRTVACHPGFRVFAAQNPQHEGGGRKGLPKSFLNRFSQVYVAALDMRDLQFICASLYPVIDSLLCERMITFNENVKEETMVKCSFGFAGMPWEFNLRDVLRWIDLWQSSVCGMRDDLNEDGSASVDAGVTSGFGNFFEMLYVQRMRTASDRARVRDMFKTVFGFLPTRSHHRPALRIMSTHIQIGTAVLERSNQRRTHKYGAPTDHLQVLPTLLPYLESLVHCVRTRSLPLLVGPSASGKSSLVRLLASMSGHVLHELCLNPGVDALELLGGFEQVDLVRRSQEITDAIESLLNDTVAQALLCPETVPAGTLAQLQSTWRSCVSSSTASQMEESHLGSFETLVSDLERLSVHLGRPTDEHERIRASLASYRRLRASGVRGQFEWMDSALVHALEQGHWILIDSVNLCSASVLDRLNPLVEVNGSVAINERGLVDGDIKVVRPHPSFRLFMAMDPAFGEISRAMRNRSIEMYLDDVVDLDMESSVSVLSHARLSTSVGLPGGVVPLLTAAMGNGDSAVINARSIVSTASLVVEQVQRGISLRDAILHATRSSVSDMVDEGDTPIIDLQRVLTPIPTCWPQFVSGQLMIQDSLVASIMTSASVLVALTASPSLSFEFMSPCAQSQLLVPRPSTKDLVQAAVSAFLQGSSLAGTQTRAHWLSLWIETGALSADPETRSILHRTLALMASPTTKTIAACARATSSALIRMGIPKPATIYYPIDIRLSGVPDIPDTVAAKPRVLASLAALEKRVKQSDQVETDVYEQAERLRIKEMSVAQLSHAVARRGLNTASLPSPAIAHVYPLLSAVRLAAMYVFADPETASADVVADLSALLDRRQDLWLSSQNTQLDLTQLVLCVWRIHKLLVVRQSALLPLLASNSDNGDDVSVNVAGVIDKAYTALGIEKVRSIGTLWKVGGITTLRDPVLASIAAELALLDAELDSGTKSPASWIAHRTITAEGADIKHAVLEGVATLHFLNEAGASSADMIKILQAVPVQLRDSIDKLHQPLVPSLQSLSRSNRQMAVAGLWPLFDTYALAKELAVIAQTFSLFTSLRSTGDHSERVDTALLSPLLRDFIHKTMTRTSFSPLHFEPLQRLCWLLDSGSQQSVPETSKLQFMHTIIQEAMHHWSRAVWTAPFDFWRPRPAADDGVETLMLRGQAIELLAIESDSDADMYHVDSRREARYRTKSSSLSFVPLYDGVAAHCFALIDSTRRAPVYAGESRNEQMRVLMNYALSDDFKQCSLASVQSHDSQVLLACIGQLFDAHSQYYSVDALKAIHAGLSRLFTQTGTDAAVSDVEQIVHLVSTASSPRLLETIHQFLLPLIQALASTQSGSSELRLGRAWVLYALAFLNTYIPDLPVDPVEMRAAKIRASAQEADRIRAAALVSAEYEFVSTGNDFPGAETEAMLATLETMEAKAVKWRARLPARPEQSQMVSIVQELRQIKLNVLRPEAVVQLIDNLALGCDVVDQQVFDQEHTLQDVLMSAIDRLETRFPLYRDLLQPVCTTLFQLKRGVQLVRHASNVARRNDAAVLLHPLVSFIQPLKIEQVDSILERTVSMRGKSQHETTIGVDVQLAVASQLTAFFASGVAVDPAIFERIHALFDALVGMWVYAEEQRAREEQERESIYVLHKSSIETDAELEEAEFRTRFPDFFDAFSDLVPVDPLADDGDDQNSADEKGTSKSSVKRTPAFGDNLAWRVVLGHRAAIDVLSAPSGSATNDFSALWTSAFSASFNAAVSVCREDGSIFPSDMDHTSRLGIAFSAASHLATFTTKTVSGSSTYDFYNDANLPEAHLVLPVLAQYESRVNDLLERWPDHDVLVGLKVICRRVASFPSVSPLMKLLTGLELLLIKSQDWDAYAGRETSLRAQLDNFVTLIVRWRKLELETWRQLLTLEERRCASMSSRIWHHLWRTIIGLARRPEPESDKAADDESNALLSDLLTSLDGFCLESSLGQFSERLRILKSFHDHLAVLERVGISQPLPHLATIKSMLSNILSYYRQFESTVIARIDAKRAPILKELRGYVKIATWKDVNVFALKESARRTHYHLNKFVKKYKQSLDEPAKPVIASFLQTPPPMTVQPRGAASNQESFWDIFQATVVSTCQSTQYGPMFTAIGGLDSAGELWSSHENNLHRVADADRLHTRMRKLTLEAASEIGFSEASIGLEDLAKAVLDRVQSFRSANAEIAEKLKSNPKAATNQKMMRKKALVDLFKCLEQIGVSRRCRQRYADQQNAFTIYTQPELDEHALIASSSSVASSTWMDDELRQISQRAHEYHFRNLARIATARTAIISVSPDITPTEVERGMSSLEHLLHLALEQRSLLAGSANHLDQWSGIVSQFRRVLTVVSSPTQLAPSGPFSRALIVSKQALDRVVATTMQSMTVSTLASDQGAAVDAVFRDRLSRVISDLVRVKTAVDASHRLHVMSKVQPALVTLSTSASDSDDTDVSSFASVASTLSFARDTLAALSLEYPEHDVLVREASLTISNELAALSAIDGSAFEAASAAHANDATDPNGHTSDEDGSAAAKVAVALDTFMDTILVAFQGLRTSVDDAVLQQTLAGAKPGQIVTGTDENSDTNAFGLHSGQILAMQSATQSIFNPKPAAHLTGCMSTLLTAVDDLVVADPMARMQLPRILARLVPLLDQYFVLYRVRLVQQFAYAKSLSKLTYVLSNLMVSLFQEGYCLPKQDDGSGDDGDNGPMQDNVDGMGIGEGDGKKDVSKEIENEDQVEDVHKQGEEQKEQPKPEQKQIKEEDDGIEMSYDFDGMLEDVDDDNDEDDDQPPPDDEEDGPDEKMGNLDQDLADVVDEKLWGDDDDKDDGGNKDQDGEDKTERGAGVDAGERETETVAKENPDDGDGDNAEEDKNKKEAEKKNDDEAEAEAKPACEEEATESPEDDKVEEDGDNDPERINEDRPDRYEDSHGVDVKDADDLDCDDDIDAEGNSDDDDGEEDNKHDDEDDTSETMDVDASKKQDDSKKKDDLTESEEDRKAEEVKDMDVYEETNVEADEPDEDPTADPETDEVDKPDEPVGDKDDQENDLTAAEAEADDDQKAPDEAGQDEQQQNGGEVPNETDSAGIDLPQQELIRPSDQPFGVQGETGNDALRGENNNGANETEIEGEEGQTQMAEDSLDSGALKRDRSSAADQRQQKQQQQQQPRDQTETNPRRSIGDALKQWLSRMKRISETGAQDAEDANDEHETDPKPDATGNEQFEFIENDDQAADAQALGVATDEQLEQMDRQALADEEKMGDYQQDNTPDDMDTDEPVEDTKPDKVAEDNQRQFSGAAASLSLRQAQNAEDEQELPKDADDQEMGTDDAHDVDMPERLHGRNADSTQSEDPPRPNVMSSRAQGIGSALENDQNDDTAPEDADDAGSDQGVDGQESDVIDYAELRRNLDERMSVWRQEGDSGAIQSRANSLWRSYVALTRELAFNLCEQLRLVLEPTLATKLRGDYRTGKRLNMRKVISYVASQFKKDRIWLRRTKPSKRTYQIMLAIDDSRSMSESRSVRLAFESLAMVSKALTQLEVGEIGIVRFGETVELVHPFERPFTDESGADLIRSFTFEQDRTQVQLMMETTMRILEHSRASQSQSGADLWQFQLVISDGICEDHSEIRSLVRRAAEQRIMVVFVVLDNRTEKDSIMNMTNVSYDVDPTTQRPELRLSRYMDTFPFDYYVVVRDIERLPMILAETLRQFFALVSSG